MRAPAGTSRDRPRTDWSATGRGLAGAPDRPARRSRARASPQKMSPAWPAPASDTTALRCRIFGAADDEVDHSHHPELMRGLHDIVATAVGPVIDVSELARRIIGAHACTR